MGSAFISKRSLLRICYRFRRYNRKAIYDQASIEGEIRLEILNEANKEIQQMKEAAREEIEQWKANEHAYIEDLKTTTLVQRKKQAIKKGMQQE